MARSKDRSSRAEIDWRSLGRRVGIVCVAIVLLIWFLASFSVVPVRQVFDLLRLPSGNDIYQKEPLTTANQRSLDIISDVAAEQAQACQVILGFHAGIWVYSATLPGPLRIYALPGLFALFSVASSIVSLLCRYSLALTNLKWLGEAEGEIGRIPPPESGPLFLFFQLQSLFLLMAVVGIGLEVIMLVLLRFGRSSTS